MKTGELQIGDDLTGPHPKPWLQTELRKDRARRTKSKTTRHRARSQCQGQRVGGVRAESPQCALHLAQVRGDRRSEGVLEGRNPTWQSAWKAQTILRLDHSRGVIQYVGSVRGWSDPTYRKLAVQLQALDPDFKPRTLLSLSSPQPVKIYTEGESDVLHLLAAKEYFTQKAEFVNLELEFLSDSGAGSDRALLTRCEGLAFTPQVTPCVCVFDRDSDRIRSEICPAGSRDYGNGVAAVMIVRPEWRGETICIEMLYRDEDLQRRDSAGRRLFTSSRSFPRRMATTSPSVFISKGPTARRWFAKKYSAWIPASRSVSARWPSRLRFWTARHPSTPWTSRASEERSRSFKKSSLGCQFAPNREAGLGGRNRDSGPTSPAPLHRITVGPSRSDGSVMTE